MTISCIDVFRTENVDFQFDLSTYVLYPSTIKNGGIMGCNGGIVGLVGGMMIYTLR